MSLERRTSGGSEKNLYFYINMTASYDEWIRSQWMKSVYLAVVPWSVLACAERLNQGMDEREVLRC